MALTSFLRQQKLHDIFEKVVAKQDKYSDLVWSARRPAIDAPVEDWTYYAYGTKTPTKVKEISEDSQILLARKAVQKIVEKYPEDYANLLGDDGRFHHGFNSGALAAFRYVLDIIETGVEHAEEEFPNLDT